MRWSGRHLLSGLALVLVAGGVALGGWRVWVLERGELARAGPWTAGAGGADRRRLLAMELRQGDAMELELCSRDGLPAELWAGRASVRVRYLPEDRTVLETPLERERLAAVRRTLDGACVSVARSRALGVGGAYALELLHHEGLGEVARLSPLRGRIRAWRPLGRLERVAVALAGFGALLLALGWLAAPRSRDPAGRGSTAGLGAVSPGAASPGAASPGAARPGAASLAATAAAVIAVVVVGGSLALVPVGGATMALGRALLLALLQVAAVAVLLRRVAGGGLGPGRAAGWMLVLGPIVGLSARILGGLLSTAVSSFAPASESAPIERLVAWPSGLVAVATVAVVVPLAEELFFRGLVYGALERWRGRALAVAGSAVLFAIAHLPQQWGAWGAFASVSMLGLLLTLLRAWSGSVLAPVLGHLAHNGTIVLASLTR